MPKKCCTHMSGERRFGAGFQYGEPRARLQCREGPTVSWLTSAGGAGSVFVCPSQPQPLQKGLGCCGALQVAHHTAGCSQSDWM